jgi:hypothetical protein
MLPLTGSLAWALYTKNLIPDLHGWFDRTQDESSKAGTGSGSG